MSLFEIMILTGFVLVAAPLVIYISVKLGTYAFFRARYLFNQDHGDQDDGQK